MCFPLLTLNVQVLVSDERVDMETSDLSLRKMADMVGVALEQLQARDRDKILALLLSRVRPSKSEFSVDEGYLTTSSTGSEQPAKCSYFTP